MYCSYRFKQSLQTHEKGSLRLALPPCQKPSPSRLKFSWRREENKKTSSDSANPTECHRRPSKKQRQKNSQTALHVTETPWRTAWPHIQGEGGAKTRGVSLGTSRPQRSSGIQFPMLKVLDSFGNLRPPRKKRGPQPETFFESAGLFCWLLVFFGRLLVAINLLV